MDERPILIHTHFHKRRTGVTRSIENVLPYFTESFKTYIYGYNVKGDVISTFSLFKLIFSKKKIIIHCHRNNEMLRILLFRFLGGKFKLITSRHAETFPSKMSLYLFKKCDVLVTLTERISNTIGIKNTLIPHGVDTNLFTPNKTIINFDAIKQSKYILSAGRIRKSKGQKVLLEAAISILKAHKEYALLLVGKIDNTSFEQDLKKIINDNKVENQVYFIDETSDIISFYQAAEIIVVPSFSEGFSLVCAEAMSCENVVVATKDVGIHSKLITNTKNGFLFQPGNITELTSVISNIITSNKNDTVGNSARKEIIENWNAKKEADSLTNIYLN